MSGTVNYVKKHFAPQLRKDLETAVAQQIAREFPKIGGPRVVTLCAQMVLEVVDRLHYRQELLAHGQVLWSAIALDDPPQRRHPATTGLPIRVVLDLTTKADIAARIAKQSPAEILTQRMVRLCEQAYEQGAVLSNIDLADLLSCSDAKISDLMTAYEHQTACPVPRRGTLHDVGTAVTHKRIICRLHYRDGKETAEIARETHHSVEAVDRYLSMYARVSACRRHGLSCEESATVLRCSLRLVRAYRELEDELRQPPSQEAHLDRERDA